MSLFNTKKKLISSRLTKFKRQKADVQKQRNKQFLMRKYILME